MIRDGKDFKYSPSWTCSHPIPSHPTQPSPGAFTSNPVRYARSACPLCFPAQRDAAKGDLASRPSDSTPPIVLGDPRCDDRCKVPRHSAGPPQTRRPGTDAFLALGARPLSDAARSPLPLPPSLPAAKERPLCCPCHVLGCKSESCLNESGMSPLSAALCFTFRADGVGQPWAPPAKADWIPPPFHGRPSTRPHSGATETVNHVGPCCTH